MTPLSLPPPYRGEHVAGGCSALAAGRAAAAAGNEEGALYWGEHEGRLECAVVLRPDRPRRATLLAIYAGALAVADALAAFAAPPAPIAFRWPAEILVDGGLAGAMSFACAASAAAAVPAWAVLGFTLALRTTGGEPGLTPTLTSLAEEGFEDFSAAAQIEGFARHLLRWLGRWESEGFAPVAEEWWRRACALPAGKPEPLCGGAGTPLRLDANGDLHVRRGGEETVLRLETALAGEDDD